MRTFWRVRFEIDDGHLGAGLERLCQFSEICLATAGVVIGIDNQDEIHRFRQVRSVRGRLHGDHVVQSGIRHGRRAPSHRVQNQLELARVDLNDDLWGDFVVNQNPLALVFLEEVFGIGPGGERN